MTITIRNLKNNLSLWTAKSLCRSFAVILLMLALQGCGDRVDLPSITRQLCVHNKEGISQLKEELKLIASDKGMEFHDYSERTQRDLKDIDSESGERADGSPLVHYVVDGKDELSVGASNISLPGYQIMLGFLGSENHAETEQFADEVIARLEKHWPIERLPPEVGAMPKPGCR